MIPALKPSDSEFTYFNNFTHLNLPQSSDPATLYRAQLQSRVKHTLVDDTLTSLQRMETFLSFNSGTCTQRGPLLYESDDIKDMPESEKGRITVIRPKSLYPGQQSLTMYSKLYPREHGAWLELHQRC